MFGVEVVAVNVGAVNSGELRQSLSYHKRTRMKAENQFSTISTHSEKQ